MVKTASGKKATASGSNESKRAVAQSRSVSSSGASRNRAAAVPSPSNSSALSTKKQSSVASAVSAGPARAAKAVRPPGKKTLGQSTSRAGSISGQSDAAG